MSADNSRPQPPASVAERSGASPATGTVIAVQLTMVAKHADGLLPAPPVIVGAGVVAAGVPVDPGVAMVR